MSASSNTSEKSKKHCDAVKFQRNIFSLSTTSILHNSTSSNLNVIKAVNNGAKLNSQQDQQQSQRHRLLQQQRQQQNHQLKQKQEIEAANKQDSSEIFQIESQKLSSDVQKVLKQEQELQKQLYSGSNVAPGWLRVNHNNKVIYISPSGIGLASLKQVKNYILTRGTCKCGLPFPLRVELFFNFSTEVPTVPLKTPIDSIKFDPTCQHRKRLATNQQQQQQHNQQTTAPKQTDVKRFKFDDNSVKQRSSGECLFPSYVTSATSRITSKTSLTPRNTVMILNNNNNNNNATLVTPSTHIQSQIVQTKQPQVALQQQRTHIQQPHFLQHDTSMMGTNVVMRVLKDDGVDADGAKLPPWRKNSIIQQTQIVKNIHQQPQQQSTTQMVSQAVPIFQINGQNVIAIDQNNQQYHLQQPQQFQIIEQKGDGTETWLTTTDGKFGKTILRRRPTFKEDPTGYLNQQTALLQNSITTLHSPNENQSGAKSQDTSNEKRQFIQQIVKAASTPAQQVTTTIGGQTVTHMPNGVVQIQQNCDIKQAQKPILSQDPIQISPSKIIRQNPKGRPPKNPQTIAKRLVAMSQESPVSSTSNVKIVKSSTPDISSSSQFSEGMTETQIIQSENSDIVKMTSKDMMRTSMTQVKTITSPTTTVTSGMTTIPLKKPTMTMLKKPTTTTMINPIKSPNAVTGQQIMMTSNGQQFIVMPQQQQPQNIMLNNNGMVQFQNTNTTNQRIIQTATGQNGNFLIQSGAGNMLTTAGNPGGNFILSNGQQLNPVFIQNGQIIQSPNMLSPKGNILLSSGSGSKTIIAGNNQPMLGQQTVLLNGHQVMLPTQTFLQDSSLMQNAQNQNNSNVMGTPEKKKGRKRKIPLPEVQQQPIQTTTSIQAPQQQNLIQGFQISQPNVIKIPQQQHSPQFILQNGQTLIQQPLNLLNGQQLMLQPGALPVMISPDGGNSIVQLQNPTFNNIIQTPQGMMIRAPIQQHQQQQQQLQKTIITNNGQQFIVNQGGMNQMFNSPMGFIVQAQQNQQQQIINAGQQPIMMQTQAHGQHILAQPQIINQTPTSMSQGTMIGQQTQYFTQSDGKVSSQRKIIHHKVQQQKFFPQMTKPPRVAQMQTFVQEIELNEEEDGENQEDEEQEENVEDMDQEEQEISFDDDKQELIQELHHGQQQVLHHSMTGDGQCGIMNIDDITIEMDEINDLNEYLNAIDEEDNRMTHIGLSSLQQQFANSPPDTTTHSPRSPVHLSSDKSNGSSDSTNMVQFVSSSEQDCISNVVSPEGVESPSSHQTIYINNSQGTFKLPEPKSSLMTSPRSTTPMSPMPQTMHIMNDRSQTSPKMRPDSHESASSSSNHRSETPTNDDNECPTKSDFDLLKESPPVNTIKPIAPEGLIESDDSNSNPLPTTNKLNSNFTVGDLIWGAARGCDAWPGKVVNGPDGEPTSSDCVWVKWFGGRQNTEMVLCSTLKSLSEGLEAHHAAQKDSRKGRKLNSHLERAIQKAMSELDKQSNKKSNERKNVTKSSKSKSTKITTATDRK